MTIKMIMDLDTGVDDALALAYALSYEEVEIVGVTTSFGNVTLENATKNTLNLLDLLGYSHIPVLLLYKEFYPCGSPPGGYKNKEAIGSSTPILSIVKYPIIMLFSSNLSVS